MLSDSEEVQTSSALEPLVTVKAGRYTVKGIAISGLYSVVMLEDLNVCFDLGIGIMASAK